MERFAVVHAPDVGSLKRLCLLFDRIVAVAPPGNLLKEPFLRQEYAYLRSQGILQYPDLEALCKASHALAAEDFESLAARPGWDLPPQLQPSAGDLGPRFFAEPVLAELHERLIQGQATEDDRRDLTIRATQYILLAQAFVEGSGLLPEFLEYAQLTVKSHVDSINFGLRLFSALLRQFPNVDAYPVFPEAAFLPDAIADKTSCLHVILENLPVPDDKTPWEKIHDFRTEEATRNHLSALMTWAAEIPRGKLTVAELNDRFEDLRGRFAQELKLHKMVASTGRLQLLVGIGQDYGGIAVGGGSVWQSLNPFARYRMHQIALLKMEQTSPVRHMGFLAHARDRFA